MRRTIYVLLLLLILMNVTACGKQTKEVLSVPVSNEENKEPEQEKTEVIYVDVCGAVNAAGVYELPKGSRVYEAIEKAGGFRADAATSEINQAEILEDGMQLYVPSVTEQTEAKEKQDGKVNINKASKEELMTLPGVGESRAESIIQYREENGKFKTLEDIMQISGIKEGLYEKLKDYIKL